MAITVGTMFNSLSVTQSAAATWASGGSAASTTGEFIVCGLATDNLTTTDGNTNDHTSITPQSGETWSKVYEYTNGQGGASSGATVSVWTCISTGSTMNGPTFNFSGNITKAAALHRGFFFSGTMGNIGTPQVLANDGADPGSMTLGSLSSGEYLWVRMIAGETNTDTTPTATAGGWAVLPWSGLSSTTGGGGAANIAIAGEHLIATGTTATSDPSWVSADHASVLVAFKETASASMTPYKNFMMQSLSH